MNLKNDNSRSKNLILNVFTGFLSQFVALFLSFLSRRIFVSFLPLDYLGINGLYTNILTVLSLTEMGLDSAFVYMLYKPLSENNSLLVSSLLKYFKKLYYAITGALVGLGLCLIPVLKYIVNIDSEVIISDRELIYYYLLFLANTIIPYFFAQYSILLSASQYNRIKHGLVICTNIVLQLMHIIVLYVFKTYEAYTITTVFMTAIYCLLLRLITRKKYTLYFQDNTAVNIDKQEIKRKVKSTILYKYGAVAINHTDNILISVIVSTAAVGAYSNYLVILNAFQGLVSTASASLLNGLGSLYATDENNDKKKDIFYSQLFVYHLVGAMGFIGLYVLLDKFIVLWLGSKYVLGKGISFCTALYFYLNNAIAPIWINREANGLFEKVKYLMIIQAIVNLTLSIMLGIFYGTFGILLATSISMILTSFWVEPQILFKTVFKMSSRYYWQRQAVYFLVTICLLFVMINVDRVMSNTIISFVAEMFMIILLCISSFSLCIMRNKEGKFLFGRIKGIIKIHKS